MYGGSIFLGFFYYMKNKKLLFISVAALDVALTVFFFVIHILMLINVAGNKSVEDIEALKNSGTLLGFFASNTTAYLLIAVIPLVLILAANIVGLVLYVRKQTKKEPIKVSDLTDEQKEALKKQLLEDIQNESK